MTTHYYDRNTGKVIPIGYYFDRELRIIRLIVPDDLSGLTKEQIDYIDNSNEFGTTIAKKLNITYNQTIAVRNRRKH